MAVAASRMAPVILHIEGDPATAGAVALAFGDKNVRTIQCGALHEALRYLRETERFPDVILLDLCLPDSSGLATLVAVVHEAVGTPIVVFTEQDADEGDLDTIRRGATEYLVKGTINLRDLAQLMVNIADSRAVPEFVSERTNSQVIQMVERVRDVMEG